MPIFLGINLKNKHRSNSFSFSKTSSLLQTGLKLKLLKVYLTSYSQVQLTIPEIKKEDNTIYAYYDKSINRLSFYVNEDLNNKQLLIAKGTYEKTRFESGWDHWTGNTYNNANPVMQCYAIGIIEGLLSYEEIYDYRKNFEEFFHGEESINSLKNFLKQADINIINKINSTLNDTDLNKFNSEDINNDPKTIAYLSCLHAQIYGLYKGYEAQAPQDMKLDVHDLYLLNTEGYYSGLVSYLSVSKTNFDSVNDFFKDEIMMNFYNTTKIEDIWKKITKKSHCSAIIKKTKDDLFFGHNTWTGYNELLRTIKKVNYEFEGQNGTLGLIPFEMSYSSYPGIMFSGDDFYEINRNIAIMQTSLSVINQFQYKDCIDPNTYIPEYMRMMIINFLSKTGEEWKNNYLNLFKGNHLYETTWMIADYNTLQKENKNYFYIIEELPKSVKWMDYSEQLNKISYFGSFNVPFFRDDHPEIVGMNHYENIDFYDREMNPRSYIFKHLENTIKDKDSFEKVLMYNGYQKNNSLLVPNDPSYSHSSEGIASKSSTSGTIDFKILDKEMMKDNNMYIYSGPLYEGNDNFKPFKKSLASESLIPYLRGIPEEFNFKPYYLNDKSLGNQRKIKTEEKKTEEKKTEEKKIGNKEKYKK
ncbi:MAG: hypothetical protein MJ252_09380, partial [archaeon]|nr:hypothetical protein [archaeon]